MHVCFEASSASHWVYLDTHAHEVILSYSQGPIITTAPDLDRACASSLLPPLPSSSSSRIRHPRAMLTIPSSSATARQQYSTAMMGRPHAIASDLDAFMHRADAAPTNIRSTAMLGTTDDIGHSSHASHGAFKLGFREQPVGYDRVTMLTNPDSALSAAGSVLDSHESGLTGTTPALEEGYMGRQMMSRGMQPDMLDESQRAVDAARAHLLLSRRVMSQGETASTASRIVESGMRSGLQPTISTVFQAFVLWFPDDIAFFHLCSVVF